MTIETVTYGPRGEKQADGVDLWMLPLIADWIEEKGDPYGWSQGLRQLAEKVKRLLR